MNATFRRRRWTAAAAVFCVVAVVAAAGYVAGTAGAKSSGGVTLRVALFGDFGYTDLYRQFER